MCFIHPHERTETRWILLSPLESRMVFCPGGVIPPPKQDGGFQKGGSGMSYYHWQPPKKEDYSSDEEFQEALSAWEYAEDTYIEDYLERQMEERENN